jgi:nitrite reductase (NO-forming)
VSILEEPRIEEHPELQTLSEPPDTGRRDNWVFASVSIALGCLVVAVIAVGLAIRFKDEGGPAEAAAFAGAPATFDVTLGDLFIEPSSIDVQAGQPIVLNVTNGGAMEHDLKLDGEVGSDMIPPGESVEVRLDGVDGSAEAWCTVPGHKEAGMVMAFNVVGAAPGDAGADPGVDAGAPAAAIDPQATPGPDWKPFDPNLQPAPGGTVHDIELSAGETTLEVAPGVTQEMWTFDGQVPGPILRGKVGDVFNLTLTNDGKVGHSIDFHASKVAWNDEMRTIQPGESLVYQFEAKHAGVFMYHCGTAPALHHIGNGMFGAIIIDPPNLPAVDHEVVLVQSELYLGAEGEPGDLTKMQDEAFDGVVFNGYHNQYAHSPIRVEPGERVRAWILDAGPSENSSFHIVGTVFDTVYKEGAYTLQPDGARGGAQALDLQPAQGGFVEFTFDEAGLYPIVTHKFSNVGKGAMGLFQAGDVDVSGAGGH